MGKSARSVLVFSVYLFVLGIVLIVVPNLLLTLFSFPETNEVWIRVVGMLVFILGFYYFQASRSEMKKFFQWPVYGRTAVLLFFIAFVVLGYAPPVLILFGIIDAVAAFWTELSLRSEKRA